MSLRVILGLVLTLAWLAAGAYYIFGYVGWEKLTTYEINELGDFLAGFLAPLFFFWLVIGYFQQGEELRQNTAALHQQYEELKRAAEQAENQAKAISANELHARRDTFLRVAELTIEELNAIAMDLLSRTASLAASKVVRQRFFQGDKNAFAEQLSSAFIQGRHTGTLETLRKFIDWPTPVIRFCEKFERLMAQAADCDPDGHLKEHFENSAFGRLYILMAQVRDREVDDGASDASGE